MNKNIERIRRIVRLIDADVFLSLLFVFVLFSFFSDRVTTSYVERFQSLINFVFSEIHSASSTDFLVIDELDYYFHDALDSSSHDALDSSFHVELDSSSDVELFRHRKILAHSLDADELMKSLSEEQMKDLSEEQMKNLSERQMKNLSEEHDRRLNKRKMGCLTHNLTR